MVSVTDILKFFRGHIAIHEPLAKYTSMRVGGPADYYVEPADRDDAVEIVRYFEQQHIPFMMLGRGSNLLISDDGIRGAAINLEAGLASIRKEGDFVIAESGARLTKLVDFCIQQGSAGVEMLAGIPGTVGGAVVMNAGAHGGETSDHLIDVEIYREKKVQRIQKQDAQFSYRHSGFEHDMVLSATFLLPMGDKEELNRRRRELILRRNETQPLELPNSGSMFKNPSHSYAARLIEQAGLKGKRVGQAQISEKHANFIVNLGDAKAADVLRLIELARRTVYQNAGIYLELEVKLIGFPEEVVEKTA
jgi:UDP-N-acetylmuramate dehydrogenase